MDRTFDEAYAKYLILLAKLDKTDDISEKNVLFGELAEQLSELEDRLKNRNKQLDREGPVEEDSELTCWI